MKAALHGIAIGYDDAGSGPALVLVHGHPFDRSMWRPQVEHFSQRGWRVIAPDLRGYGDSTAVADEIPFETFARDIAALLDQLAAGPIVLAGLSMGGQIAMDFYRLFSERVRGLVLADTTPQAESDAGKRTRRAMAERLLREGMAGYADEVLPAMVAPANLRTNPAVGEHVLRMMRGTAPAGAAAALRARAERHDYVELLGRVAVPALIVVGRDDEFTPVSDAQFMHERIPGSILAIVDNAAHMPNLEQPIEFNAAVEQLLAIVSARQP